jgi:hypothetical protein
MLTPFMSAYEPESRSDGSIDPLGLQADASRLADLMLPGFTVRVDRLRALTIATAITQLARQLSPERPIPYRLCLERVFLDALVARTETTIEPAVRGFPGRSKARNARLRRQPLTLERYIKGPATNGLVGSYATLARWSGLFDDDDGLLPRGDEVLSAWEADHHASGLVRDGGDDENDLRRRIDRIVRKDLDGAPFDPSGVRDALFPLVRLDRPGSRERAVLASALDDDRAEPQPFVLERLRAELPAYRDWVSPNEDTDTAERASRGAFERAVVERWQKLSGSSEDESIALVARTAVTYERVSQLLTAAFDALRWRAAQAAGNPIAIEEVVDDRRTRRTLDAVLHALGPANAELETRRVALAARASRFTAWKNKPAEVASNSAVLINAFQAVRTPRELLEAVVIRHRKVQDAKRKGHWMVADGSRFRFLGAYQLVSDAPPMPNRDFLHAFRLVNALSILSDLEA